jgi:transcriptional regulator with PAS, ATPase and Fis domain
VAHAIHQWSGRKGQFHAVNCAALPANLAESELFGHRRGAFTGSERDGLGHIRAADEGTLFLDEIQELPLSIQAKLLRVVEERRVLPLGETRSIPVDLRIIAAFQRPVDQLVSGGSFREDLAARLTGITVELPPLRTRRADAALLFLEFIRKHTGGRPPAVEARLLESLCLYTWPRNVREVEQLARQVLVLHGLEQVLRRDHLPNHMQSVPVGEDRDAPLANPGEERSEYDLRRLVVALRNNEGNVKAAARDVGISRQRAYRLMDGRSVGELVNDTALAPLGENRGGE